MPSYLHILIPEILYKNNNNAPKELFYGILASNLIDFNKDCIDTRNFINSKFEKICDILINSSFSKKKICILNFTSKQKC